MVFTRLSAEEMKTVIIDPENVTTPHDVITNDIESSEVTEELNDIQATFQDIDTATELQEELQEKVVSVEMLQPNEYNLYVANDLHASYTKACKLMGLEPKHISNESMDNAITLSTEGIKEVIQKIIIIIKQIIGKIVDKIKQLWLKIQVMISNDEKTAKILVSEINEINTKSSEQEIIEYVKNAANLETVLPKILNRIVGLKYLSNDHLDTHSVINTLQKLTSSNAVVFPDGSNLLEHLKIAGIEITFNEFLNDFKFNNLKTKKDLTLDLAIVTGFEGNKINLFLRYLGKNNSSYKILFDYKPVYLDTRVTTEDIVSFSSNVIKELLHDNAKNIIKMLAHNKHLITMLQKDLDNRISYLKSFLANAEKDYVNGVENKHLINPNGHVVLTGNIDNSKDKLENVRNLSIILPNIYIDQIKTILYVNKTYLILLAYYKTVIKEMSKK